MTRLVLPSPGNEAFASSLAREIGAEVGGVESRRFPDDETYVRLLCDVAGREVVVVASLRGPDRLFLPLAFLADAARDLGAARVGLVAPYLAYMRQDARFRPGEAVTSRTFARLLGSAFDWLVTVDPHLHRHRGLAELYAVPTRVAHAAPSVAEWIRREVPDAFVLGPDEESAQWTSDVAARAGVPHVVLAKIRGGDRYVSVSAPDLDAVRGRTPVVVDDIVSTARTMIAAVRMLGEKGFADAVCVGVHAVFAERAYEELSAAGAARVVTCDTIPHETNAIGLTRAVGDAVRFLPRDQSGAPAAGDGAH